MISTATPIKKQKARRANRAANDISDKIDNFLSALKPNPLIEIFDHLPDTYFFMKDRNSKLITCNRLMLGLFGRTCVEEIYGKTGFDFFPSRIAGPFIDDDRRVMEEERPMIDGIELNFAEDGHIAWFSTTKMPLYNQANVVCGLVGVTRKLKAADHMLHPGARMMPIIEYIKAHLTEELDIETLADQFGLSRSQFHRSFKNIFRQTPQQFIMKLRMQQACSMLLGSDFNIGEISGEMGFTDQNYFARAFRKVVGLSPTDYRDKYRGR